MTVTECEYVAGRQKTGTDQMPAPTVPRTRVRQRINAARADGAAVFAVGEFGFELQTRCDRGVEAQ